MTGPLGRVALPVLSTLREDGERYRRYIRSAALVIGYFTLPTYAVAAGVSRTARPAAPRARMDEAATIFSLLAIAGFAQAIGNVQGWIYISLGHSHRQFVYYLVTRPIIIGGFFFGIWWGGINGLVIMYGIMTILLLVPGFAFAIRGTFVTAGDIARPILRPALLAPLAFAAAWTAVSLLPLPTLLALLVGGVAGAVPMLAALAIPAYRRDARQIMAFVAQMKKPRAKTAPPTEEVP